MGTKITLSRRTPANHLEGVQNDDYLWEIAAELEQYLAQQQLPRVTATNVANFLTPHHGTVTLTEVPYVYLDVWDPDELMWITVCIKRSTISVLDAGQPEPVDVVVELTASYA
jgi:hypothetical protein